MHKKYILSILFSAAIAGLPAQVVVNLQLPPTGLMVKSQLWNLSVVNTTNQAIQARVECSMVNLSNNQRVLTATTRVLSFPKGLKQLQPGEVAPVTYNILSPEYRLDGSAEGFLPIGSFELCYSVIRIDQDASETIAESCETVIIEPISPPQLVSPPDSEQVEVGRPLFNWLPPSPFQLFTNLVYDFNLVEVQGLQTGGDAIQQNIPLHTQGNLTAPNLSYPPSLPELDTGRLYAWQVTARSGGSEVAKSEIWTFKIHPPLPDSIKTAPVYYTRLKREKDAGYAVCTGVLHYAYLNEVNDKEIFFGVYDLSHAAGQAVRLDSSSLSLHFGENLGHLDFITDPILKDKHIYLLELINSRGEHWVLKFQFRKPD